MVSVLTSVMLPVVAVTSRLPPTFEAARLTPDALTRVALPPAPLVVTAMGPVTVSWLRSMSAPDAVVMKVAEPPTRTRSVRGPVSVMPVAPPLVTLRLPSMSSAPSATLAAVNRMVRLRRSVSAVNVGKAAEACALVRDTSRIRVRSPPKLTAPARLLPVLPSRTSESLTVTVSAVVPVTVSVEPVSCVMWPAEVMLRSPWTLLVPRTVAPALDSVAWPLAPVVVAEMAPVTVSWSSVMSAPVAVVMNSAVPPTRTRSEAGPVSVMPVDPPLVTCRLPSTSTAPSATLAALKLMVRLRRSLRAVNDGSAADALPLAMARSRISVRSPPKLMVPRLLPELPSRMSESLVVTVRVVVPPTLSVVPVAWVMLPPEVTLKAPWTSLVPSTMALVLLTLALEMLVRLVVAKEAAPTSVTLVRAMFCSRLVVANDEVPVTLSATELLMEPEPTMTLRLPDTFDAVPANARSPLLRIVALPPLVVVTATLVACRSTLMPVLPAFSVTWPEPARISPPVPVVMPPRPSVSEPDPSAALAVRVIVPEPCARSVNVPMLMSRPACSTTFLPLSIVRLALKMMSREACRRSSATPSRSSTSRVMSDPLLAAKATSGVGEAWSTKAAPPLPARMMSRGSSSSTPPTPNGATRLTLPSNTSDCLPDTSTKPPLPLCAPPRASMLPK